MGPRDFWSRRRMMGLGLAGLALGAFGPAGALRPGRAFGAGTRGDERPGRILVVLELSGGNDGLNTLVPYGDDAYYRLRPRLGLRPDKLRRIDGRYGFNAGMAGFERLYKDGRMAAVHGCGYEGPSFSHFTSMAYWHTAAPNSGSPYGWVGRLADALEPEGRPNFVVNIDARESLAVRGRRHVPVVFDRPEGFRRKGYRAQRGLMDRTADPAGAATPAQRHLRQVARSARDASEKIREAWANYDTPMDYGLVHLDLPKIAALIEAGMPARLYYTSFRDNAFDTHVHQANLHARLLTYASDAVSAFFQDLDRIGRADDVTMLVFSEFGRRAGENANKGTDHGTANTMFAIGKPVRGGHYGEAPSLTDLDEGGNMRHTVDFRRVYASAIEGWMGHADAGDVLNGRFDPFPLYG